MRRGFTIIELSVVLTVMALLVAVTVPTYQAFVYRARADEARTFVQAVAHAELRYRRDHGQFLACPAEGPVPRAAAPFPTSACWRALGLPVEGTAWFRYGVAVDGEGYTVTAEADLDGDGETSRYQLDGQTLALTVERPLE